jgi:hypothetical protein
MLGFRYMKAAPTTYVLQYRGGKLRREGAGLSFIYFAPSSTVVAVPAGSTDVPFIFNETTADFQAVTVQGHLTFRVVDPKKLSALLDYRIDPAGRPLSEDPEKLPLRITHAAQTAMRAEIGGRPLRAVLTESDGTEARVRAALASSPTLKELGCELLGFSVLAVRPSPETAKALEAEAREKMLREADDALYLRRNNSVEQERKIKENELATEVAVAAKQRQISETKLAGQIALEEKRRQLVELETANARTKADTEAYALAATLAPLGKLDPKALQVLAARGVDPRLAIAQAFQEIAGNAAKVGTLNISPELLETLTRK